MISKLSAGNLALLLTGMCLFLIFKTYAQPNYPRSPEQAELIYTDLENFVEAWQELLTEVVRQGS